MNPTEALEWLLDNGAGEELEDETVDLEGETASDAGRLRQQQEVAAGKISLVCNHLFCKLLRNSGIIRRN
jgi:hypothetical protein